MNEQITKKEKITQLVLDGLKNSLNCAETTLLPKIFKSGCVDIDGWDENNNPMILIKSIMIAILENEANQYSVKGTQFQKEVRKMSNKIKLFL